MAAHVEGLVVCACPACAGAPGGGEDAPQAAVGSDLTGGATKPVRDLAWVIANLARNNYKWDVGRPVEFDFVLAASGSQSPFPEPLKALTRQAFEMIADLVPLTFVEGAAPKVGTITLGFNSALGDGIWGQASTSRSGTRITGSDIEVSTQAAAERAWMIGGYNFQALVHEILHALGIPHPGNYNAGDGQTIDYDTHATYFQDSRQYTIMSYFGPGSTGAAWATTGAGGGIWSPATPMLHDVAALQAIYGANTATRSGDTVYGYDSNSGRDWYDFDKLATPVVTPSGATVIPAPVFTIWDGGGNDTLNLSRATTPVELDLREGAFSSTHGMKWNIAIAHGAVIENATGGAFNDTITGNAAANVLDGGAGDDFLFGGAGDDVLIGGAGADTLIGGDGYDTGILDGFSRAYVLDLKSGSAAPKAGFFGLDVASEVETFRFLDGVRTTDPNSVGAQVFRLYQSALGRAPDPEGLSHWAQEIEKNGRELLTVAEQFVASPEFNIRFGGPSLTNAEFVTVLYANVLGRAPDPGGLVNWVSYLSGGASRAMTLVQFSESQENITGTASLVSRGIWVGDPVAAMLARLYDSVFDRLPDAGGLANWLNALNAGMTETQVAAAFIGSEEFQLRYGALNNEDFMVQLYLNVLDRAPDAAGLLNWVRELNAGVSREEIVLRFSESLEHKMLMAPFVDDGVWLLG
jgi:hypothetical protein